MKKQKSSLSVTEQEVNQVLFWASVLVTSAAFVVVMFFMSGVAKDLLILPGIFYFFVIRALEPILGKYVRHLYEAPSSQCHSDGKKPGSERKGHSPGYSGRA